MVGSVAAAHLSLPRSSTFSLSLAPHAGTSTATDKPDDGQKTDHDQTTTVVVDNNNNDNTMIDHPHQYNHSREASLSSLYSSSLGGSCSRRDGRTRTRAYTLPGPNILIDMLAKSSGGNAQEARTNGSEGELSEGIETEMSNIIIGL